MKKFLVITGGAGFVGSNLIKHLILKTKYKILGIDNYSSGSRANHIKNKGLNTLKVILLKIEKLLKKYRLRIHTIFHFGEFTRIYQSFKNHR